MAGQFYQLRATYMQPGMQPFRLHALFYFICIEAQKLAQLDGVMIDFIGCAGTSGSRGLCGSDVTFSTRLLEMPKWSIEKIRC